MSSRHIILQSEYANDIRCKLFEDISNMINGIGDRILEVSDVILSTAQTSYSCTGHVTMAFTARACWSKIGHATQNIVSQCATSKISCELRHKSLRRIHTIHFDCNSTSIPSFSSKGTSLVTSQEEN